RQRAGLFACAPRPRGKPRLSPYHNLWLSAFRPLAGDTMPDSGLAPFRLLDLTAANPAARADPYPRLAALRAECPIHRDDAGGAWFVGRMADARVVLSDNSHAKDPDRAEPAAVAIRRRRAT